MGAFENQARDELIDALAFFGLDRMDSVTYLTLLDYGPSTMSQLASKIEVDRGRIYRGMEKLVNLGIVKLNNNKVTTCEALDPETAFMILIEKKKTEVFHLKKIAGPLTKELESITRPKKSSAMPTFSLIEGRDSIYMRIGKLIQESSHPVYLVTTTDDFVRMFQTSIPEKIKIAESNGVQIRVIIDGNNPLLSDVLKHAPISEIRVGQLPSSSRIIVEKENQLLMSGTIKNTKALIDDTESILYTNSKDITENMYSLCEQIWKKSKISVYSKVN